MNPYQTTHHNWIDGRGNDLFGHWVTFSVTDPQGDKVTQRLRWIEPGTFLMGSPEDEPDHYYQESPQHPVTLSRGFWLFNTPCTQALWQVVMGSNPSLFQGDDRPVEQVNWNDCQIFLKKLNERLPGLDLDLPSEAQWEYACRAGTTTPFSFGANVTPEQVNYNVDGKKGMYREQTVPVASLPPNSWGLYEMHGNVWEWCRDGQRVYQCQAETDPIGPLKTGAHRVFRGGDWSDCACFVRAAYRHDSDPVIRLGDLGFRCIRV